ncbi:spore coat protein U domain-containing protein [Psychrobacter arenosus]|uniref:Csu type fimbrial protein n=1 Tax=Psychrobacter arenosus TaxID=256326 RepID=UPI00191918DF|nr:spore coat protein U domain-containing protein [Psychrobacter arenosus]
MKLFQWHFGLYLIPLAFLLPMSNLQAAVNCTASMPTVDLGSITSTNADNANITVNINYKCNSTYVNSRRLYVCLAVDGGSYDPTITLPRYMSQGTTTPNIPRLAFTITLPNGTLLSTRNNANLKSEYKSVLHNIPGGGSINIDVPIKISLLPNNGNISATPGFYINNFTGGNTALTTDVSPLGGDGSLLDCTTGTQGSIRFPFKVQATVIKDCKIETIADVNLNSRAATATNITGNTVIGVTCTNNTPYTISLTPSNNSTTGAGEMSGTSGNLDKVPYNLRKVISGTSSSWGNISNNWVTGTGNAVNKDETVYVDVPSADFKPDTYSDTVTIRVNY